MLSTRYARWLAAPANAIPERSKKLFSAKMVCQRTKNKAMVWRKDWRGPYCGCNVTY